MSESFEERVLDQYTTIVRDIAVTIAITTTKDSYTSNYVISISGISKTTETILEQIREELIRKLELGDLMLDETAKAINETFKKELNTALEKYFPFEDNETKQVLSGYIISRSLGMGYVDFLLNDDNLEEIAIDNAEEPVWVYHRKHGWLKTNIYMSNEHQIQQIAARIGRTVGRQINTLQPLLDAYLPSGERINATIKPITPNGNTITMRRFSDDPWTITKFIQNNTLSSEAAALLWQTIQYEMSVLVVGGTASGKTSMLNALGNFFPPNQRIISIEDTRELRLASHLYWVPMMTRLANAEGKGEVQMGDLLVNSLRMRPDRVLVGEVRRQREAETMFEAIHTGHSVYGTFHANNTEEAVIRLTNSPINLPKILLPAVNLMLVQFRNRRSGKRRTLELAELTDDSTPNILYQLDVKKDQLVRHNAPQRLVKELGLFTGMSPTELNNDLKEKKRILDLMVHLNIHNVEEVGKIIADYYKDPKHALKELEDRAAMHKK